MVQQESLGKAFAMQKSSARSRTGRVSATTFINALNFRYAVIKGRYDTIEQECELVSEQALLDAQDRVVSQKNLMRRVLDAIEVVARDIDPDWSIKPITPIPPKKRDDQTGQIMPTARKILRKVGRPMTVREISKSVAEDRGLDQGEPTLRRLDRAILSGLKSRVGKEISVLPGSPQRYFVGPSDCA